MKIDVVALGEVLIDFATHSTDASGYPILAAQPGGAPCNYLAALQRYGCSTAMLAKVGEDVFGNLLLDTLRSKGIDIRGVVRDPSVFTTLAFVTLDDTGNRTFSFARKPGADTCLCEDELLLNLIDDAQVFHFGTLSLTDEPARTATRRAVNYAKGKGKLISVDPNLRKNLWPDDISARTQIDWALRQANIVKISDEEVDFMWGIDAESGAQKLLSEFGVELVYVTLGSKGCHTANINGCVTVSAPSGIRTIDTTGAGDIFGGSAMNRYLQLDKAPYNLTLSELESISRFACCAASLSTQIRGGMDSVPSLEQVLAIM